MHLWQMVRNFRKPLVVAAPKTLLRSPVATSQLPQMAPGTSFQPVLGDTHAVNKHVTRVVFVSGKHYYTLQAYRELHNIQNTAIIRVEVGTDSHTHISKCFNKKRLILCILYIYPHALYVQEICKIILVIITNICKIVIFWKISLTKGSATWCFVMEPHFALITHYNLTGLGKFTY